VKLFRSFSSGPPLVERQRQTALRWPCRLASEVSLARYHFVVDGATVGLTINTGWE
jgi:hypothetical protein